MVDQHQIDSWVAQRPCRERELRVISPHQGRIFRALWSFSLPDLPHLVPVWSVFVDLSERAGPRALPIASLEVDQSRTADAGNDVFGIPRIHLAGHLVRPRFYLRYLVA